MGLLEHQKDLGKSDFIDLLGSIWDDVFIERNIKSGFRKTGIYPLDRTVYPESEFNVDKLAFYKREQAEAARPILRKEATPQQHRKNTLLPLQLLRNMVLCQH